MKPAISVEYLSKYYRIGVAQNSNNPLRRKHRTLRETITESVTNSWNRFRKRPSLASLENGALLTEGAKGLAPTAIVNGTLPSAQPDESMIWALKDVSLEVQHGEVVGVIGANGSGKSTLLKILASIVEPSSGRVTLYGRVGSLLEVGTGFHPDLTGRDNVYLNGSILGMSRKEIDKKFDEIVAFSEIERFLDTPVKRYSSGMFVRLAFAVAAHLDPDILLVDEVLSVGDSAFQRKCLRKIGRVSKDGITVLFISHDMGTVQKLCKRTMLLVKGKLEEQGKTETVITTYEGKSLEVENAVQSATGEYDLTNHPTRFQGYEQIIRQLKLYDGNNKLTKLFYPDDTFQAELTLEYNKPLLDPRVALAIEDAFGRRVTTLATFFQNDKLGLLSRRSRVRCVLPQLRLGTGRYLLSVCVMDKNGEVLDMLENALSFEVGWRNNYGNGEAFHPLYGPVLTQSSWQRLD